MIHSPEHGRHRKIPSTARRVAGVALRLALVASAGGTGGAGTTLFADHIVVPYAENLMAGSSASENPKPKITHSPKAHEIPPQVLNIAAFSTQVLDEAFSASSDEFGYLSSGRSASATIPIGKLSCTVFMASTETLSGSMGESLPDPSHATDIRIGCFNGKYLKSAEFKYTRKGWLIGLSTIFITGVQHEQSQHVLANSPDATTLTNHADSYALQTLQHIQPVFTPPPPPQLLTAGSY